MAGTWGGKIVLWTEPNAENNFQISAKSRTGHRGDILVLDSDENNIISGGVDGLITVWNRFSGVRKFAFGLPDPIDEKNPSEVATEAQNQIRKRISDLMFHPFYSNLICILQDSGNVHLVDTSNGSIVADFVAFARANSSWACDKKKQNVFVVGDMGKAIMYNACISEAHSGVAQLAASQAQKNRGDTKNTY